MRTGIYKRILSVMIEALENVYKNSETYYDNSFIRKNYLPSFKLFKDKNKYRIFVSNPIMNENIPGLKNRLDLINSKTIEELKILYRQTITNGMFTEKGGAGLGLIEMSKISGAPLNYTFEPVVDEKFSIFSLDIVFENQKD